MSQHKVCTKCSASKATDCFSAQAKGRYGVTSICKSCTSERGKAWSLANPDRAAANRMRYQAANPGKGRAVSAQWRADNQERERLRAAAWSKGNPGKKAAAAARRRAAKKQATPAWANHADMARFYTLAAQLTKQTGVKANVDHVVPLQSPLVCGLHCSANLSIDTAALNKRKGNNWWPDMPGSDDDGIPPATALMSVRRGSSLIEYAAAFAASNGAVLKDRATQ